MKRATIAALIGIAAVIPGRSYAYNGNDWQGWNKTSKIIYVGGVADTWKYLAHMLKEYKPVTETDRNLVANSYLLAHECLKTGMTYNQITAIVEKWMQDHPELWQNDMSSIVWAAMHESCHK